MFTELTIESAPPAARRAMTATQNTSGTSRQASRGWPPRRTCSTGS